MPLLKASIKDVRRTAKRTKRNTAVISKIKTMVKKVRAAKNPEEAKKLLAEAIPVFDKAAKVNIIHKNKASRLKSKLSHLVHQLSAAKAS